MAADDDGATTYKAPRADEEASCDMTTGATEWLGSGAAVACNTTVAGRDAASAGCLAGW